MLNIEIQRYYFWEKKEKFLLSEDTDTHWVVYLIEGGSCSYEIGKTRKVAHAGDVILCPPFVTFKRSVKETLTLHFFRFTIDTELFDLQKIGTSFKINDKDRIQSTYQILKEIQFDDSEKINSFRNHLLSDILFMKFHEQCKVKNPIESLSYNDSLIREATIRLSDLSEEVSITDLAKGLGVNPSYFSQKFKKAMLMSPIEYRNKMRLIRSQKLLIESDKTIEAIAEECGYLNGFYFSRVFTKFLGICPSKYRQQHKL